MKKKLLLLVAALVAMIGANAQTADTLHVTGGNTSSTTEYVPIYGYFADYGFHTEMIYPAWQVDTMAGNALMGITFYTGGSSANANVSFSETFYLYLEEVSATGYGSQFKMSDQAQLVWIGSVTITDGQWNITFDTPYEYNGGNLLVTVLCHGQTGGSCPHVYFNAYTLSDANLHPSAYGLASSNHQMPNNAGASIYLPEVSIAYSSDVCHRPQGLMVDSVGTNMAALHWDTVSGATAYEWKLLDGDTVMDSGTTVLPSLTLGALEPSTTYQLRVRTICSSINAVNLYSLYSFTTACGTLTAADLPYVEDFESYDHLATSVPCWTMLAYSRPELLRVESATYGFDTSKVLSLWPDSNSLPQFAVMPRMENIADLRMTFRMHSGGNVNGSGILQVGVMTNAVDTQTFIPMAIFVTVGWQELEVDFDAFTGTSGHIAFRAGMPPTQRMAYVEIDDIMVIVDTIDHGPGCLPVQSIEVVNVTSSTTNLIIHDTTSDDATYLVSVNHSMGHCVFQQTITDTTLTITGLAGATTYRVHVLKRCADGTEYATVSATFHTLCGPVTELPWSESFENCGSSLPECWTTINQSSNILSVGGSIHYGPGMHALWAYSVDIPEMLVVLPEFSVQPDSLLLSLDVLRYQYGYDSAAGVEVGVITDITDATTFMPIVSCVPSDVWSWGHYQATFPGCTSGRLALRFLIVDNVAEAAHTIVDNVTVELMPATLDDTCAQPTAIYVDAIHSDGATLHIVSPMAIPHFMLYVDSDSVELFSSAYTITGLEADSLFTVGVSSICADGSLTARTEVQFRTDTVAEPPVPPVPQEPFKYWVRFTDKQGTPYTLSNPSAYLSQRALERRARKGVQIDSLDLPVNPAYVQTVAATGADVRYTSRWLNGLLAYLPAGQSTDTIAALPFVAEVTCIDSIGACEVPRAMSMGSDTTAFEWTEPYSEEWYGYSYTQMKMHNAAAMHSAGYTGQGVLIGVMDGGFHSIDTNSVMRRAREEGRIVATRNFVEPSMSVYEDTLFHGSNVLHFIGAYAPGYVMGTAMDAQFALCVTEDSRIENVTEEYHMAAALEFLDSLGADIVNASLGYTRFVPYERRDGQTEVASIAGNIASAKGMAFVTSAGNSGHIAGSPYIGIPADAEYVFAVGAVASDSSAAYFTSIGPTADGRMKPDAASYGHMITQAQYDGRFSIGSGTSYASPILCGLMACVLQQHPEYTPYQLYDTIRSWGHMADNPNDTLGYGIPDFSRSLHNPAGISDLESQTSTLCIYPNPAADRLTVSGLDEGATLQILDIYGRVVSTAKATRGCTLDVSTLSSGTYLIRTMGKRSLGTAKFIKR